MSLTSLIVLALQVHFWKEEKKEERKEGRKNRCQEDMEKQQANYVAAANHWESGIVAIDKQGWIDGWGHKQTDPHTHMRE